MKWVNDIWLEGRKVCGILCEAGYTPEGSLDHVIVGMGVNVAAPPKGFPEELKDIA
ncbi:MAG: biotin--[acetyl-CoA-carboxylase] ligase, partial [Oscillospiraceae bacterium]|nr:biotin--[acetyl-CoA-carboxylase] ligase [Oscillospiraceae bacterium]